ncbi:MAG TPA: choice-of-anchor I family protein [Verrucomicrobiae bacterium]|nr:choice-of-anchor I family protein [Verrucomicrobiae bacterium]
MKTTQLKKWFAFAVMAFGATASQAASDALEFNLTPIGRYTNDAPFELSAAEIVTHDPIWQRLYVGNARDIRVDILDIHDPAHPTKIGHLDMSPYGKVVNSVDVKNGIVAVAVEAAVKTDPGVVVFFDSGQQHLRTVVVGSLPDMVTFSPDGRWVLVANEGEPNTYNNFGSETNGPSVDPEGSVSIIDMSGGAAAATARTADFRAYTRANLPPGVRVYGPGATPAQDFEPEYIAVSDDSTTAWVTLQENNALAIVDILNGVVTDVVPLGFKDHNQPGAGLDASDQDNRTINIRPWPIKGMYMPDSIAAYRFRSGTYLVMANEGDTRDWPGFREDVRLSTRKLDPIAFPNGDELKRTNNLGRLAVSSVDGDLDGDGDLDEIYSYGGRSFSIRDAAGNLILDSGDQLEQLTAALFPNNFNASHSNNSFDNRSPSKGPEPEGVAVGKVAGRTLAFIGLERIGGVAVYDVTNPFDVGLVDYVNTRSFAGSFNFATSGDLGPEGLHFISADDSPNGKALLAVAHEISGSTVIFEINKRNAGR